MPNLNYTTPLHNFSSGNLSFTATKECYLCGSISGSGAYTVNINGTALFTTAWSNTLYNSKSIPCMKLNAGDTVTVGNAMNNLFVLDVL